MQPVTIGGLDEQDVRFGDGRGVRQHRTAVATEIATEQDRLSIEPDPRVRGAEQVTRVDELDRRGLTPEGYRAVVAHRLQQAQSTRGVDRRVQGQRRLVLREPVTVCLAGILFLQMSGVRQHQRTEILRRGRAEHAASKPGGNQTRQVPAVIQVRVGQDERVNGGGIDRQRCPITQPQLFQPLKKPAIDEDSASVSFEEVLGARDSAGGAEKRQARRRHVLA